MEPVSTTLITYISSKLIEQFLKEEGYGRIKKWIFPQKKYREELISVIYDSIAEHEKHFPYDKQGSKFPFYHSQILFEELNKHVLFSSQYSNKEIINKLRGNPNIIIPTTSELNSVYNTFTRKINENITLKKLFIDENYKMRIFDIYESIKSIEGIVLSIQGQLFIKLDQDWFNRQCKASIHDLGNRYTPELNFELEVSEIFDGLGRTEKFKKNFIGRYNQLIIRGKKVLKDNSATKEYIEKLEINFDQLQELFSSTHFQGTDYIPKDKFHEILDSTQKLTEEIENYYLEEERKLQKEKNDYQFYHKYGHEIRNIQEFENKLTGFIQYIESIIFNLANNPFLVMDGEAGIGKSHMIGDIISKRIKNDYESIFLLGQHFVTDEDPWLQIFKGLQINSKVDDFLLKINERGKKSGKRIILFIDAINEGRGRYFWMDYIKSFINEVKTYEWIGLVLTIRSSYKDLIFPKKEIDKLKIIELKLFGFKNVEYEASKLFFNNYKIDLPNVPLLHPEFQNPLFLKLFCEGINKSGLNKIPDGLQGISSIFNFFITSVNNVLSRPNRVNYPKSLNLVKKSIDTLIEYKTVNQLRYIPYEKAFELTEETVSKYIDKKGFIEELISEGVLSKNLFWKAAQEHEEGIYLAYERFENHLVAKYLLDKEQNLKEEFKESGKLFNFVKDEHSININKGLIDALSIQIPEKIDKELFDFVPTLKDKYPIIESFVESLLWRKVETINDKSRDYANEYVFLYQRTYDLFWEIVIAVTAIPGHYFNAYLLHNHLMKFSIAERDAEWTQFLKYKYSDDSSVKRLIDWAWDDTNKSHISNEAVKLSSIALAWFHTSTNRQLRDCSTKALICLLQNRIDVLIEVLKMFEGVNDPYIYERLFAVAYGCSLRTSQIKLLPKLCEYIFKTIFKEKEEVYPHALLRDYARGVIEFTYYMGFPLSFKIDFVRPPYKSFFKKNTLVMIL